MEERLCEMSINMNHFTVYKPLGSFMRWLFFTLIMIPIFVLTLPIWGSPTSSWPLSVFFLIPTLSVVGAFASCALWKVEVLGHEIYYRSLLKTIVFPFKSISKAEVDSYAEYLTLHSNDNKSLSISTTSIGFYDIVTRLRQENIGLEISEHLVGLKEASRIETKIRKICIWIFFICTAFIVFVLVFLWRSV